MFIGFFFLLKDTMSSSMTIDETLLSLEGMNYKRAPDCQTTGNREFLPCSAGFTLFPESRCVILLGHQLT